MVKRLAGFAAGSPKAAGLDPATLADFRKAVRREAEGLRSLAGAAHVVLHRGKCVFACAGGYADRARGRRFALNTLCRLHGATKPLLAAAFLTLVDAGRCRLSDPVAKHVRFPDRVAAPRRKVPAGPKTARARRPATLRDLLTMSSGLACEGAPGFRKVARRARRGEISDLEGLCGELADLPLQSQPGARYDYGYSFDLLGRVCEVVSGLPLDQFVERSLLRPLGMSDTHFAVPPGKAGRAAKLYTAKKRRPATGRSRAAPYELAPWTHPDSAPGILSGGGGITSYNDAGMWSTAQDYARFCQMLLDGGRSQGGKQVLKQRTVSALWRDGLGPLGRRDGRLPGWHDGDGAAKGGWWDYRGLSLLHAYQDLDQPPRGGGAARRSDSMWFSGGGGAFWTAERRRGLVTVSFSQTLGGRASESDGHGPLGYRISPYL